MPILDTSEGWWNPETRPDWLAVTAVGRFSVAIDGARFERHHHDDHELWLIHAGKAKILTDGLEHYVQAGDVVLTQAGDSHDFLEVYERIEGFFVETGYPKAGRVGHLYRDAADAEGHDVPALPLPADFPARPAGA